MVHKKPENIELRLRELVDATIAEGSAQLLQIAAARKEIPIGGADAKLVTATSALMRAMTSAVAELRQQEKHNFQVSRTPEQRFKLVLEYLTTLDSAQLLEVKKAISKAREHGKLLA